MEQAAAAAQNAMALDPEVLMPFDARHVHNARQPHTESALAPPPPGRTQLLPATAAFSSLRPGRRRAPGAPWASGHCESSWGPWLTWARGQ